MHEHPGNRSEPVVEYLPHRRIVGRIAQIDDHLSQVVRRRLPLGEQRFDVFEHPHGLARDVFRSHDLSPVIDTGRSGQQDMAAVAVPDAHPPLERHAVLVGRIQIIPGMQVSLLSGLQPLHGVSVEQDGASRVAVTAFDPGTRNVMGLRRQSMPFEKPATSPDDSPVIDVHVLHKKPGADAIVLQRASESGQQVRVTRQQCLGLIGRSAAQGGSSRCPNMPVTVMIGRDSGRNRSDFDIRL